MNTSQANQDGLVFVKIGTVDPWYINVASIVRMFELNKKDCKKKEQSHPTLGLDIIGSETAIYIEGITGEQMMMKINKAIKDHYNNIINKELLG